MWVPYPPHTTTTTTTTSRASVQKVGRPWARVLQRPRATRAPAPACTRAARRSETSTYSSASVLYTSRPSAVTSPLRIHRSKIAGSISAPGRGVGAGIFIFGICNSVVGHYGFLGGSTWVHAEYTMCSCEPGLVLN